MSWRLPTAALALTLTTALLHVGCGTTGGAAPGRSVIVLGFDGMDYTVTKTLLERGRLPNLARLARSGGFAPLGTSVPSQSPVAWSTFATGLDAGGHGIFDFVHRDPATFEPYLSTTRTEPARWTLRLGRWQIPVSGGRIESLRKGQPFWEVLDSQGVETTVIRMPANFPPSGTAAYELSGMGTPDLLGTYGTFSFYSSIPFAFAGRTLSGGTGHQVQVANGVVETRIYGPRNPFRTDGEKLSAPFQVYVDASRPVAKLVAGDTERILQVGEWSDWIALTFPMAPTQAVTGICRFYLKQTQPDFEMYVTPVNLDPLDPALPISTPADYAAELARATGRFYTQGMPEDTKSLKEGLLAPEEFLAQARLVEAEYVRQFRYVLEHFRGGFLFYYFGNADQVSHMMWRAMDPGHPAYDAKRDAPFAHVVEDLYVEFDGLVGETMTRAGPDTMVVVMSDHGFTSWRRSFHLNSWLWQHGYLAVVDPTRRNDPGFFADVDWPRTRAYGLGLNGLYINLKGREQRGIVEPGDRERLMAEISAELLATVDPATGLPAVAKVYAREQAFHDRGALDVGPDLVVGYAKGTRGSDESALGSVPLQVIVDNMSAWSGDHCMDPESVPGVLFTNRPLQVKATSLQGLAAAILAEFGIHGFPRRAAGTEP